MWNPQTPVAFGKALALLVCVTCLLTVSCTVRSIHSWLKKESLVFEDELLGGWVGTDVEGKDVAMTFVRDGENTYVVQYSGQNTQGTFIAQLGRFGADYYLDFRPKEGAPGADGLLMFPTHGVARLEIGKERLNVFLLDYGAVTAEAKLDRLRDVKYSWEEKDEFVFTSSTEEMQRFLLGLGRDSKLFAQPMKLTRKK